MSDTEITKLISEIITSNAEALFSASTKFITDKTDRIKAKLTSTFSKYVQNIQRNYSSTKTIIYRDTPQSIKEFYEPIGLYNDKYNLENPKINDLLNLEFPIIITGTGGSGKSTFLKYLLLNTIEKTKLIPIFIELRLVEKEKKTLLEYICESLELNKVDLTEEYLKIAFEKGNFIFFLDGFDELSQEYAQSISSEIDKMVQQFPLSHFIITSRPGQEYVSWTNFIELKTKPLTVEKAISLIKRLNYDPEIKTNFINELKSNLYESHQSFFENPLLLSIMLITFRDSASIPSELHNFYSLAFEALYYRHDASKAFKRPTLTNLPIDKGKEILAAFSLISYINNQTLFSYSELKNTLESSLKLTNIECNINHFVTDLQKAYCMLIQDGTKYQYTHRSFQEYFSAYYLVNTSSEKQDILIKQFISRADTDLTLQLAHGMNSKLLEEKLIIPFLKEMSLIINPHQTLSKESFLNFSKTYFSSVVFMRDAHVGLSVAYSDEESSNQLDKNKYTKLSVTRLILNIYNVNRDFDYKKNGFASDIHFSDSTKSHVEVKIEDAFKDESLLEWFTFHSLEAKVIKELMNIYENLTTKSKQESDIFQRLIEEKTSPNKSIADSRA